MLRKKGMEVDTCCVIGQCRAELKMKYSGDGNYSVRAKVAMRKEKLIIFVESDFLKGWVVVVLTVYFFM